MKQREKKKINKDQGIEKIKQDQEIDRKELERIIFPKEELLITE